MIFKNYFSFFIYNNHHLFSFLSSRYEKKEKKCKMNNAGINLHENYSNFANLYIFNLINVGDFGAI